VPPKGSLAHSSMVNQPESIRLHGSLTPSTRFVSHCRNSLCTRPTRTIERRSTEEEDVLARWITFRFVVSRIKRRGKGKKQNEFISLPLDKRQSSLDAKTPVAVIVSLQITPLYGLCGKPEARRRGKKSFLATTSFVIINSLSFFRYVIRRSVAASQLAEKTLDMRSRRRGGSVLQKCHFVMEVRHSFCGIQTFKAFLSLLVWARDACFTLALVSINRKFPHKSFQNSNSGQFLSCIAAHSGNVIS
jgi:hypothetical protein